MQRAIFSFISFFFCMLTDNKFFIERVAIKKANGKRIIWGVRDTMWGHLNMKLEIKTLWYAAKFSIVTAKRLKVKIIKSALSSEIYRARIHLMTLNALCDLKALL